MDFPVFDAYFFQSDTLNYIYMNILFDVLIANPNLPEEVTVEQNIVLDEMYSLVKERIQVLEEEIDKEETELPYKPKATIIYLRSKAIQPRGYSEQLCDKIIACFSPTDIQLMMLRIENALKNLLN